MSLSSSLDPERFHDLLRLAAEAQPVDESVSALLKLVGEIAGASQSSMIVAQDGSWQSVGSTVPADGPGRGLLEQVSDRGEPAQSDNWTVAPLAGDKWLVCLLACRDITISLADFRLLASAAERVLQITHRLDLQQRRAQRLATMLNIANRWHNTLELEPLLDDMARAAVQLLDAERATIFLWDRSTKTLVGRPALGVDEGELRIPDTTGVVGRVVQSGQPERVAAIHAASEIDHSIGAKVQFETRNLVCVPLINHRGRVQGAFQLLNSLEGDFSSADERELTELAAHAASAIDNCRSFRRLVAPLHSAEEDGLFGHSPPITAVRDTIQRVAPSHLPVLLLGENGTGKEVASRLIHRLSPRRDQPFVAINCAAITESLLESELFGHEKGAFTDAHEARSGKLELADRGTLFLDEIGELPMASQAKLLRAIEEGVIIRVGGSHEISTDVRILAATNRDLPSMVRERSFREDLFFRLNVVTVQMPALRERPDDIVGLARHFLEEFAAVANRSVPELEKNALQRLRGHAWPGNVRELRNLMHRMVYLASGPTISEADLQLDAGDELPAAPLPLNEATKAFQVDYIERQIALAKGNMAEAARRLGLHRSNLYRKLGQLGMDD